MASGKSDITKTNMQNPTTTSVTSRTMSAGAAQHPTQHSTFFASMSPQYCATYMFPTQTTTIPSGLTFTPNISRELFPAATSSPNTYTDLRSRGHIRSISHGGATLSSAITAPAPIPPPRSAMKGSRSGHQRALSQGQVSQLMPSDNSLLKPTHSRTGSRTNFELPPGHKDKEDDELAPPATTSASGTRLAPSKGHSRQASRSESIYTLRRSETPPAWRRWLRIILRRKSRDQNDDAYKYRKVVPNHIVPPKTPRKEHPNGKRVDNKIRTTKYTLISFLPRNLLEQFHRVANLYFIFIVLLNWFPNINAFGKEIAMIPVMFVLGVTAVKDLFEDRRRRASDQRINNSTCRIYKSEEDRYRRVLWKDVQVGDLIHLSNNEMIPADILLLRSSDPNGLCYLDTSHLDGEANLKLRQVPRGFIEKQPVFEPSKFRSIIEVDAPSTKIYRFHGAVLHPNGERVPVGTENLLLRECVLKNTDFVEGIIVYAGHETKAMLNNGGPRYKRSKLERQMNLDVIWCVIILVVLCAIGACGCYFWNRAYPESVNFLPFGAGLQEPFSESLLTFWTFVIILQIMIPLSLYVTIELSKILQVYHIHHDLSGWDAEMQRRVECRALNITEELGQVQYIFSDKTGTLTENKMIFRHCCINGIDYHHGSNVDHAEIDTNEKRSTPKSTFKTSGIYATKSTSVDSNFSKASKITTPVVYPNVKLRDEFDTYVDSTQRILASQLALIEHPGEIEEYASTSSHKSLSTSKTSSNTSSDSTALANGANMQEFLMLLAICNTVVVSKHPHHDAMNASGVIEFVPNENVKSMKSLLSVMTRPIHHHHHHHHASKHHHVSVSQVAPATVANTIATQQFLHEEIADTTDNLKSQPPDLLADKTNEYYTRLTESRSITPSPVSNEANESRLLSPAITKSQMTSPINRPDGPTPILKAKYFNRTNVLNLPGYIFSNCRRNSALNEREIKDRSLSVEDLQRLSHDEDVNASTSSSIRGMVEVNPIYEAESPDELALVNAACAYNCKLLKHTPQCATVHVPGHGILEFEILNVLPFDSTRKCMSVIFRNPLTGLITVYTKGADTAVLGKLAPMYDEESKQILYRTQQQVNTYAKQGLRVLVMAKKILSDAEYTQWALINDECEMAFENREKKMRDHYAKLECNLMLLGSTGIEDRLQEGVPEALAALSAAGLIIWVLTGDKPETAINIAYSARLFDADMEILKLMTRSKDAAENTILFYLNEIQKQMLDEDVEHLGANLNDPNHLRHLASIKKKHRKRALVVDGKTLTFILDKRSNLTKPFLQLSCYCASVLCCRATPLQKAYIVKVVKEELHMRTLAIGDGANDVSMIQTADVGIGISGQEGMQAVMASDFTVPRFKYLERLLLVHGHWCYDRLATMILYFFYKNAAFVFLVFWYQLYCGFSGAVMIDQMYLMLYNLLFTSLPPIAIGVYDQDAPDQLLQSQPRLYRQGRLNLAYKPHSFWITMADALYQSIAIYFIAQAAYMDTSVGVWEFGTTLTTCCMFIMVFHAAIETKSWSLLHVMSVVMSVGAFFLFSLVYHSISGSILGLPSMYMIIQSCMGSHVYWAVVLLTSVVAVLPRFLFRILETTLYPNEITEALITYRKAQMNEPAVAGVKITL